MTDYSVCEELFLQFLEIIIVLVGRLPCNLFGRRAYGLEITLPCLPKVNLFSPVTYGSSVRVLPVTGTVVGKELFGVKALITDLKSIIFKILNRGS